MRGPDPWLLDLRFFDSWFFDNRFFDLWLGDHLRGDLLFGRLLGHRLLWDEWQKRSGCRHRGAARLRENVVNRQSRIVGGLSCGKWPGLLAISKAILQRVGEFESRWKALRWIFGQGACKRVAQPVQGRARQLVEPGGSLGADRREAPPPEQLVRKRGKGEHIGTAIPRTAHDAFGRGVRATHRHLHPNVFERPGHANAGEPHVVWRDQDVAWVKGAMNDAHDGRVIEPSGNLRDDP